MQRCSAGSLFPVLNEKRYHCRFFDTLVLSCSVQVLTCNVYIDYSTFFGIHHTLSVATSHKRVFDLSWLLLCKVWKRSIVL